MDLQGSLFWICVLAVLSDSVPQDETLDVKNEVCKMIADVKVAADCNDSLMQWGTERTAVLLLSMRNLTNTLHRYQLQECHGAQPSQCPEPEVPENGGLACVTIANKRYCKPLCNYGFDFGFLRRSRLYDECSEQTGHKWNTQYIGGNKLAVCHEASIQVSGGKTAYFPKDQDCLTTKSFSNLQNRTLTDFTTELKKQKINGDPQFACLVCG